MDVGCTRGFRSDYRLRLWAPTSASRTIVAVAELLVSQLSLAAYWAAYISQRQQVVVGSSHQSCCA